MKFTVAREGIAPQLEAAARIAAKGDLVTLKHDGKMLKVLADGNDITLTARIPCAGEAGEVTLPGRLLSDWVKRLDGVLEFRLEQKSLSVGGAKIATQQEGRPIKDYAPGSVVVPGEPFLRALRRAKTAASWEEIGRPVLTGVNFSEHGLWGSDGARASMVPPGFVPELVAGIQSAVLTTAIVPVRAVNEVLKLMGDISIGQDGTTIHFSTDAVTIVSPTIEGQFPALYKVLPTSWEFKYVCNIAPLVAAVERVSLFARRYSRAAPVIRWEFASGKILLHGEGEMGSADVEVEAKGDAGVNVTSHFNAEFLLDGLRTQEGKEVEISYAGALKPMLLTSVGYTYVILPMQVPK